MGNYLATFALLALAVAAAIAWCIWLERHPEVAAGEEGDESRPHSLASAKGRT